jgi:acyl transferase domain-containing protein
MKRRRVPLPTYPFERQRYWIDEHPRCAPSTQEVLPVVKAGSPDDWIWIPTRRTAPIILRDTPQKQLLILDEGPGAGIAGVLRSSCEKVVRVMPSARFEQVGALDFELNPESYSDYRQLMERLRDSELMPDRILYLWGMAGRKHASFYGLLFLSRALAAVAQSGSFEIVAV